MRLHSKPLAVWGLTLCLLLGSGPRLAASPRPEGKGVLLSQVDRAEAGGGSAERQDLNAERRKARSRFTYLALGYGLVWLALGVYLLQLHRRTARVAYEIDALSRRLAGSDQDGM